MVGFGDVFKQQKMFLVIASFYELFNDCRAASKSSSGLSIWFMTKCGVLNIDFGLQNGCTLTDRTFLKVKLSLPQDSRSAVGNLSSWAISRWAGLAPEYALLGATIPARALVSSTPRISFEISKWSAFATFLFIFSFSYKYPTNKSIINHRLLYSPQDWLHDLCY